MTLLYALVLLGILIFVHEFGHFLFAKLSGVKVLTFSLGFGPKIFGKKVDDTEYMIAAVPLGGYVKMLGEDPGEEVKESERELSFSSQPVYKRLSIVLAGPLFNLFFAALVFCVIFMTGIPRLKAVIGEVMDDSPAMSAGLRAGDRIVAIEEKETEFWDEITEIIYQNPGNQLDITIKRNNETIGMSIVPEKKSSTNIFGEESEVGMIGIKPEGKTETISFGPIESLLLGIERTWDITKLTFIAIIKLIQQIIPADTIGGPVMIFQMAGEQAQAGLTNFLTFMAVISINLGVLNLLPIPILDGGHIFFMVIESIRKKPLSDNIMIAFQRVGLALIIALMFFALYNDFTRLLQPQPPH